MGEPGSPTLGGCSGKSHLQGGGPKTKKKGKGGRKKGGPTGGKKTGERINFEVKLLNRGGREQTLTLKGVTKPEGTGREREKKNKKNTEWEIKKWGGQTKVSQERDLYTERGKGKGKEDEEKERRRHLKRVKEEGKKNVRSKAGLGKRTREGISGPEKGGREKKKEKKSSALFGGILN